jgi:hypothetical protein
VIDSERLKWINHKLETISEYVKTETPRLLKEAENRLFSPLPSDFEDKMRAFTSYSKPLKSFERMINELLE